MWLISSGVFQHSGWFLGRVFYHAGGDTVLPVVFEYDWIACTREEYRTMQRGKRLYRPVFKDVIAIPNMWMIKEHSRLTGVKTLLWCTEKYPFRERKQPLEKENDKDLRQHMEQAYADWKRKHGQRNGNTTVNEETYRREVELMLAFNM